MTGLWVWVKEGQTIESATALTPGTVMCLWIWHCPFLSMEELERFVRRFAEDKTVITPCAIPVKSSREAVKKILASWLDSEPSTASQTTFPNTDNLSLSPHKPEPAVIPIHQDRWNSMWFDMSSFGRIWSVSTFSIWDISIFWTGMTQTCSQAQASALIGKEGCPIAGKWSAAIGIALILAGGFKKVCIIMHNLL